MQPSRLLLVAGTKAGAGCGIKNAAIYLDPSGSSASSRVRPRASLYANCDGPTACPSLLLTRSNAS
jgi:hypothetical protein